MKSYSSLLRGLLATLLLAIGLTKAAEHFDPITRALGATAESNTSTALLSSLPCIDPN